MLYDPVLIISYLIYYIYIVGYDAGIIVYCVISYDMELMLYLATDVNVYDVVLFGLIRVILLFCYFGLFGVILVI